MRVRPTFAFLPPRPPLAAVLAAAFLAAAFLAAAFLSAAFLAAAAVVSTAAALGGGLPPRPGAKPVRLARFQAGGSTHYGIVEGDRLRRISGDVFASWQAGDETFAIKDVKLLPPTSPSKVLAVGLNYKSHLGERPAPKVPEIFFKVPSAIIASGENIVIPPGTADVHFEGELVIVIGRRAKNVPPEKAQGYILGVTCGNDVSARDWQKGDLQWWRAKGSDTFAPCGPFIAQGINYDDVGLELRLNGEVKQKARTSDLLHGTSAIVSWVSRHVTLEPGDLIYTGTPGQTTALKPGDTVEVEIEGIGVLRNGVEAAREGAAR